MMGLTKLKKFMKRWLPLVCLPKIFIRERWFKAEENFGISLSNRAGMMENAGFAIQNLSSSMKSPCYYPAHTFFLNYTGEVLMCAHDWGMKRVLGDYTEQSFLDIWFGEEFTMARSQLIKGNRQFSPCDVCNVQGTRMGKHALQWQSPLERKPEHGCRCHNSAGLRH